MTSFLCCAALDLGTLHFPSAHTAPFCTSAGIGKVLGPGVPFGIAGGRIRGSGGNEKGGIVCAAAAAMACAMPLSTMVS